MGDAEIRKGDGMQLDQLIDDTSSRETNARIQPFNLDVLVEAFQLRETAPIDLPPVMNCLGFCEISFSWKQICPPFPIRFWSWDLLIVVFQMYLSLGLSCGVL